MAFFGSSETKQQAPSSNAKSNSISSATIVTAGTELVGTMKGNDSVHIDGTVKGDIVVNNMVVIGKSGIVDGVVKGQKVMISGELRGSIECDDLEIMQSGKVSDDIKAKNIILDGQVEGLIVAENSIHVTFNGNVSAKRIKSQKVMVDGTVKGDVVATELLEIGPKGYVEGAITVKNIKTHEGGRIIGSMATYMEAIKEAVVSTPAPEVVAEVKPEDLMKFD